MGVTALLASTLHFLGALFKCSLLYSRKKYMEYFLCILVPRGAVFVCYKQDNMSQCVRAVGV